jgi:hypothetical protein
MPPETETKTEGSVGTGSAQVASSAEDARRGGWGGQGGSHSLGGNGGSTHAAGAEVGNEGGEGLRRVRGGGGGGGSRTEGGLRAGWGVDVGAVCEMRRLRVVCVSRSRQALTFPVSAELTAGVNETPHYLYFLVLFCTSKASKLTHTHASQLRRGDLLHS